MEQIVKSYITIQGHLDQSSDRQRTQMFFLNFQQRLITPRKLQTRRRLLFVLPVTNTGSFSCSAHSHYHISLTVVSLLRGASCPSCLPSWQPVLYRLPATSCNCSSLRNTLLTLHVFFFPDTKWLHCAVATQRNLIYGSETAQVQFTFSSIATNNFKNSW